MSYMVDLQWEILRKLEYPVAKLVVVAAIVGFSDASSAPKEKRTGDDKKVMEAEESIYCILNRLWYPGVGIDHYSNSIVHTVVYGQIDSYATDVFSKDMWSAVGVPSNSPYQLLR
ncbi:hypothetical protein TNCV_3366901 [Trichonephila clavipes]|nr:hypothetical protein TNCV_3366901 [Trichonephila clavipes]